MAKRMAVGSALGQTKTTKSRNEYTVKGRGKTGGLSRSSRGASEERYAVMTVHASGPNEYRVVGASDEQGTTWSLAAVVVSFAEREESPVSAFHRLIR